MYRVKYIIPGVERNPSNFSFEKNIVFDSRKLLNYPLYALHYLIRII